MENSNIVQKLWSLCNVLRDDGITYQDYVTELTYILFLKMVDELGKSEEWLPEGYRWEDLTKVDGVDRFNFYRELLLELGKEDNTGEKQIHSRVNQIYFNASTNLDKPANLDKIVSEIDKIDWYDSNRDNFGDLYEGLLEKNSTEVKSGAGQYFTPRPLIESMIHVLKPKAGEKIQDPAAGTCGFLIYADKFIKDNSNDLAELPKALVEFQKKEAFYGIELVSGTHRLALMNMMLHDIQSDLKQGSALSQIGEALEKADLILSNPPFGTAKGGGNITRSDFTHSTSNKQLNFLQHIYRGLKRGGRAGVVLPDNVLFEEGVGTRIREDLMNKCNLHTILRLPTGIFYKPGVKANVLFFSKGDFIEGNTKEVWIYDLRTNMKKFGKTNPLKPSDFIDFEKCYGEDPTGKNPRTESERFKKYTFEEIKEKRNFNLDFRWLKDESSGNHEDLPAPDILIREAQTELEAVMKGLNSILAELPKSEEV